LYIQLEGYLREKASIVFLYVFHPAVSSGGIEIEESVFGVGETDCGVEVGICIVGKTGGFKTCFCNF